ncbi:MAG: Lrp/AsnC ligand binding domain-containing protein [Thaumarchaeota archaeon]|nr:Lrp/AsnC ligand binding domain-containing protein [Nitrososphaerales archaeon]NSL73838.1 Lrp/AsnC ligand binding domain-containing protein [Nitrososphaerota archaeon]NSL75761.1 Lrp/AsnC ligand binding domain-containing protein [Nitrososphaerota archaeon]NSL76690.1 Lrp/AsnC ligand binding domain-containing protein [Nitrososphaerota archaeon]NSL77083.1 Lrp/AsnC ligand binding domain-containing protein [Nitrososphaerota archaeon]
MPKAYVLINTESDVEEEFIQEVKQMEGVIEVASVYGRYDFVVIIESDTMEKVKNIITNKIRRIRSVKSTITLIGV